MGSSRSKSSLGWGRRLVLDSSYWEQRSVWGKLQRGCGEEAWRLLREKERGGRWASKMGTDLEICMWAEVARAPGTCVEW